MAEFLENRELFSYKKPLPSLLIFHLFQQLNLEDFAESEEISELEVYKQKIPSLSIYIVHCLYPHNFLHFRVSSSTSILT